MAEPAQVRQRGRQDVGIGGGGFGQHRLSAATLPRHRPGRFRLLGCIAVIGGVLLLGSTAEARPGKLIASSSDSGSSFVSPSVFVLDIERPEWLRFRVTMDPQAPASGEAYVNCDRGKREVGREFPWTSAVSFTKAIPLAPRRPEDCFVAIDFSYDEYDQAGTAKIELFGKRRRRR